MLLRCHDMFMLLLLGRVEDGAESVRIRHVCLMNA